MAPIDVATSIHLAILRRYDDVMLTSTNINDVVAVLKSKEVVLDLMKVVDMVIPAHARTEHVLPVLTIEPDPVVMRQDDSEEFTVNNLFEVLAVFRFRDLSKLLLAL